MGFIDRLDVFNYLDDVGQCMPFALEDAIGSQRGHNEQDKNGAGFRRLTEGMV